MDWQLHPIDTFEQHRQTWDRINSEHGETPLLDSRFVAALLEHFSRKNEKLAVCTDNNTTCAMAIVTKSGLGTWETFQPSQAPLGCWVQDNKFPIDLLGNSLRKSLPGAFILLGVTQQDPDILPRPKTSKNQSTIDYITTAKVTVNGTFDDYWSSRGKNLRQNLRRQRNRLARENVETNFTTIFDAPSMHDAVCKYGELESVGWKAESNTAVHIDNAQGKFYSSILQQFAETRQAIVFQYRYDDKLVATDFCIVGGGSLIIMKTTYDESINTTSPAILMREDEFKTIFSGQLAQRIEFYGKVMDWHTKWSNEMRTMYHANFYSTLGSLAKALKR